MDTAQPDDISTWRALVVDDEPDNLSLVGDLLELSGGTVFLASTGIEALRIFERERPNLVLLDLSMPEMDGWQVHRQLREQPAAVHVPIVALTALAMPADAVRVRAAGFDGYVTKPFYMAALLDQLRLCMRQFAAQPGGKS